MKSYFNVTVVFLTQDLYLSVFYYRNGSMGYFQSTLKYASGNVCTLWGGLTANGSDSKSSGGSHRLIADKWQCNIADSFQSKSLSTLFLQDGMTFSSISSMCSLLTMAIDRLS